MRQQEQEQKEPLPGNPPTNVREEGEKEEPGEKAVNQEEGAEKEEAVGTDVRNRREETEDTDTEQILRQIMDKRQETLTRMEEINSEIEAVSEKELRESMISVYGGVKLDKQEKMFLSIFLSPPSIFQYYPSLTAIPSQITFCLAMQ